MPNVHLTVGSTMVTIGNTVKVMCRGFGYPPPTLSLSMPNGSVKNFTSPTEFKSNVTIGVLAEGEGVYTCSSTNDVGTVQETKIVKGVRQFVPKCYHILYDFAWLVIPSVRLIVSSETVKIGNTVKVACQGFGHPPPTLSLSMPNGSVNIFTSPTEFKSNVMIGELAEGGGVYTCSSTNDDGAVQETKIVNGVHNFVPKCDHIL